MEARLYSKDQMDKGVTLCDYLRSVKCKILFVSPMSKSWSEDSLYVVSISATELRIVVLTVKAAQRYFSGKLGVEWALKSEAVTVPDATKLGGQIAFDAALSSKCCN